MWKVLLDSGKSEWTEILSFKDFQKIVATEIEIVEIILKIRKHGRANEKDEKIYSFLCSQ